MKLDLYNVDDFIDINELEECSSGVLFQRGGVPHPKGLVSNEIFGVTVQSRKETFAYLNLYGRFFHPHVYKVVHSVFRNIDKIISGDEFYSINKEGILVVDRENGDTGIDFIYNNWEKITWKKSGSTEEEENTGVGMRKERMGLLNILPKDEAFLTKFPIIPVFYRDITSDSRGGKSGDLNKYYADLIRLSSLLRNRDLFGFQFGSTTFSIQQILVSIYDLFKQKLQKKNGMIRRYLMGKTIDNSVRTVITAPTYHSERPEDMMIDYYHCAIPISQICALAYPFMMEWIKGFLDREIISNSLEKIIYNPYDDKIEKTVRLKDPASYFNEKWIEGIMDSYIRDPSSRFNKIEVPVEGSTKPMYLHLTGKRMGTKADLSSTVYRPMTITDLLYIAASEVTKDKMAKVVRYPLTEEFSFIFSHIRINSTTKTEPMMINGRLYKWYPVIDFNVPKSNIASKFIDSMQFSNAYLKGIDGDYDGDQCSVQIFWSQEANDEVKKYVHQPGYFIKSPGFMVRTIESEAVQTFYTLTKDYEDRKELSATDTKELLDIKAEDYSFSMLIRMFGTRKNDTTNKMEPPKYHPGDVIRIPANYLGNSHPIETTVGRFIWYMVVIRRSKIPYEIRPLVNKPITMKTCASIEKDLGTNLIEERIDTNQLATYINNRDWLGLQLHAVVCTSFTPKILFMPKTIRDYKKKLVKEHEAGLRSGDPRSGEAVEKELIAKAQEVLKNDPGMDLYDSGARGSFDNNYKNINLIRGPVYNESTKKFDFIANSLMDGLRKEDFAANSNTIVNGAYPKSIGTAESGYLGKELNAIMQMERLDPDINSDCGTKFLLTVHLTKNTIHQYDYRYIVENGKLKCLTPDIIENYAGQTVKMRSVMFCKGNAKGEKCAKCCGIYFYKTNKMFIGLQTGQISGTITKANMKKFHANLIRTSKIDPKTLLI